MSNEISVKESLSARNMVPFNPSSLQEMIQFSRIAATSGMVPKCYIDKPGAILVAIQMGVEIGLAPMQAIQNIAVINGRPSIWGDAMLALVLSSPLCDDVTEYIEGTGDQMVAVCEVKRKGRKSPIISRFSMKDAAKAGLLRKEGPWQTYPSRMLQLRARGFGLRDGFPDVLRGLISVEEARDIPTDNKVVVQPIQKKNVNDDVLTVEDKPSVKEKKKSLSPDEALKIATKMADNFMDKMMKCSDIDGLKELTEQEKYQLFIERAKEVYPDLAEKVEEFAKKSFRVLSFLEESEFEEIEM